MAALIALLAALGSSVAEGQQRRITGRVTGAAGEPLASTTVTVVGTAIGTYTSEDGRFSLNAPSGDVSLLVRRIGFRRKSVPVAASQSVVEVTLERDVLELEAQVVTGQATSVSRLNAPNAISQVSGEQLNKAPTPTIENALQGKIAGATISQNSGAPGGGAQVRMRGVTSILGKTDPLYIVDGVIVSNDVIQPGTNAVLLASSGTRAASSQDNGVNRIADLNPADIESIEVLKGASASGIYGSDASNGVIIITTKKGSSGRTQFNLTQRVGTFDLSNKLGARRFSLDEAYDFGTGYGLDSATILDNFNRCGGYCDHEEQLYGRHDLAYETSLSMRGGSEATRFFASGLVKRDPSIQNNAGYNKQSFRLNVTQVASSRLTMQLTSNLIHTLTQRSLSNNDNVNVTPYFVLPSTPSFFDLRPRNGIYPRNPFTSSNPIETLDKVRTPEEVYRLLGAVNATYSLVSSERQTLQLRADAGVDHFSQATNVISPRDLQFEPLDGLPGTATALSGSNVNANAGLSLTHSYFPASRLFSLTTSGGVQRQIRRQHVQNIVAQDVVQGQENIQRGAATLAFDDRSDVRDLAVWAQEEMFALDERLTLVLSGRAQRSTVNGDPDEFFFFPRAAASYRVPNFYAPIGEFKVRVAYGQAGNPPLASAQFTPAIAGVYAGQSGVQAGGRQGDANIRPERSTELEGGVDLAAFGDRLSLTVTGYQKTITDMLLRPSLAPSTGFISRDINAGKMRNRGIEIELGGTTIRSTDLNMLTRVNFSRNVGKVISLPDIVGRVQCLNAAGTGLQTDPKQCPRGFTAGAFGFFYGQGRIEEGASPSQMVGQDTIPGGGGAIYQRSFGNMEPDFTMGFSNEITYRGFRLYGLLDWRHGGLIANLTRSVYVDLGTDPDTARARRLTEKSDLNISPYIEDGSFVKLRELTLGYELPEGLRDALFGGRARGVRLELSGRNLITWTDYSGIDPEVSNFGNTNIVRNQDLAPFPPSRSYFLTVDVSF